MMKRTIEESNASGSTSSDPDGNAEVREDEQRGHRTRARRTPSEGDLSISEISRILGIPRVCYPPSHTAPRAAVSAVQLPLDEPRSALAPAASTSSLPNAYTVTDIDNPSATNNTFDAHPVAYFSSQHHLPVLEGNPLSPSGLFTAPSATAGSSISIFDEFAATFDREPYLQIPVVPDIAARPPQEGGLPHLLDPASDESADVVFDFSFLDDIYAFSSNLDQHPPARETTPTQSQSTPRLAAAESVEPTVPVLLELLDFRGLSTTDAIAQRFKLIASELIHRHRIEVRTPNSITEQLEILEIEFYLFKTGCHEDPYTHASVEQRRAGQWYFHRDRRSYCHTIASIKTSDYLSGTRKALSLTLGQPAGSENTTSIYGGALIRSVARASDGDVIHGPWAVVNEILRLSGTRTIEELTVTNWQGDISAIPGPLQSSSRKSTQLYVVRPQTSPMSAVPITDRDLLLADGARAIFSSPRVALELSDVRASTAGASTTPTSTTDLLSRPGVAFFPAPYRFYVAPYLVASSRSERAPTYLGVHDLLLASGQYTTGTPSEMLEAAARLTGLQHTSKYFIALRDALKDAVPEEAVRVGNAAGASIGGAADLELLREWVEADNKKPMQNALKWLQLVRMLRRLQGLTSS